MPRNLKQPDRPAQKDPFLGRHLWNKWKHDAAGPEYAQAAFAVFNSCGQVTRRGYLVMMLDMEEKSPGQGSREQMDELERFYYKRGLDLKGRPRIR